MALENSSKNRSPISDLNVLTHPAILFSIFTLLLNDHVLKIYFPSWLTGKLSGFAGLFFFPILLSAILNILCKPLNIKRDHLAVIAFSTTALWFGLIKTLPFFSHLTEIFLSRLLWQPAQIICDPTDLIALVMLLPAWKLRTIYKKQPSAKNSKLAYLALCAGSIAAMATGDYNVPHFYIRNLTIYENTIYAYTGSDSGSYTNPNKLIFYSLDNGKTWSKADFDIPSPVIDDLAKPRNLPVTVCLPKQSNICYRTDSHAIVQSFDGGKTWNTSWSISLAQYRFMSYSNPYMSLGPYDLIAFEEEGKPVLIAALGNQGVLIKTNDEPWESAGINGMGPITYKEGSLVDAIGIVGQEIIVISLVSLILLILNVLVNIKRTGNQGYTLLRVALAIFVASIIAWGFSPILISLHFFPITLLASFLFYFIQIAFPLSILMVIIFLFQQLITNITKQGIIGIIILTVVWLTSCALYILWVYDVIHETKTIIVIIASMDVCYLLWILWQLLKSIRWPLAKNS